jgi:DNA-binding transcriptional LysR family regulator
VAGESRHFAETKRKVVRMPGNMLLDGIRGGDGIGATVPAFIADELKSGKLVALFDDPIPEIGYYLVTLPGASTGIKALHAMAFAINDRVRAKPLQMEASPPAMTARSNRPWPCDSNVRRAAVAARH